MRRLRESWLAFGGSALIIALSVSSALGADPALDAIENLGQQVSDFADGGVSGQNEGDGANAVEADDPALADEELDEADEADDELEPGDEGYEWANHGECVSWHAHQDENADADEETSDEEGAEAEEDSDEPLEPGAEGYEWANHGEFVSYAAQVVCRALDDDEEADEADDEAVPAEEEADAELEPGDEGYEWANQGECVSWHAHQKDNNGEEEWRNHGAYVSNASRTTCRDLEGDDEDTEDADEADGADHEEDADARAERKAEKADRKAERKAAKRNGG